MAENLPQGLQPPVFNGEGYAVWAIKMEVYMQGRDLWETVEDDYAVDVPTEDATISQLRWLRETITKKARARSFLYQALAPSIFTRIMKVEFSKENLGLLERRVPGRIRDFPDRKEKPISILQVNPDNQTLRVRTDIGYRDFSLDGISFSEEEDLDAFYKKFVESRINGVKLGAKCTIMMCGPTGSGKSHTMFGCSKQPGIVYQSLRDILGEGVERNEENDEQMLPLGRFVQVSVLEVYNEEIYDLLSSNNGSGLGFGWPKSNSASKVRLEVMGKKEQEKMLLTYLEMMLEKS